MNADQITFGCEFEVLMPVAAMQQRGIVAGGYHRGIQVPGLPAGWNAQNDSSINTSQAGMVGIEIVSPILKGAEGIEQVRQVCRWFAEIGAKVNLSCGFHVHVGFDRYDARSLARLVCLVAHHELALYAVTGTKSRTISTYPNPGFYCKTVKANDKMFATSRSGRMGVYTHNDRYHVLNLQNLANGTKRAVEFRVFAGTTNGVKAAAYIQLCVGLVAKATSTKAKPSWNAKPTSGKRHAGKGEGESALARLFDAIGWRKAGVNLTPLGLLTPTDKRAMMAELKRLAKKFDGPVENQDAA